MRTLAPRYPAQRACPKGCRSRRPPGAPRRGHSKGSWLQLGVGVAACVAHMACRQAGRRVVCRHRCDSCGGKGRAGGHRLCQRNGLLLDVSASGTFTDAEAPANLAARAALAHHQAPRLLSSSTCSAPANRRAAAAAGRAAAARVPGCQLLRQEARAHQLIASCPQKAPLFRPAAADRPSRGLPQPHLYVPRPRHRPPRLRYAAPRRGPPTCTRLRRSAVPRHTRRWQQSPLDVYPLDVCLAGGSPGNPSQAPLSMHSPREASHLPARLQDWGV